MAHVAPMCVAVFLVTCQAVLNGRPLVKNLSSPVTGVAVLNVNLQENPGNYTLILSVRGSLNLSEVWTKLEVQVVPCGPGQINVTGELTLVQKQPIRDGSSVSIMPGMQPHHRAVDLGPLLVTPLDTASLL